MKHLKLFDVKISWQFLTSQNLILLNRQQLYANERYRQFHPQRRAAFGEYFAVGIMTVGVSLWPFGWGRQRRLWRSASGKNRSKCSVRSFQKQSFTKKTALSFPPITTKYDRILELRHLLINVVNLSADYSHKCTFLTSAGVDNLIRLLIDFIGF